MQQLSLQTAAFVARDLSVLVERAAFAALERMSEHKDPKELAAAGPFITNADFSAALSLSRNSYSESIGAPKVFFYK